MKTYRDVMFSCLGHFQEFSVFATVLVSNNARLVLVVFQTLVPCFVGSRRYKQTTATEHKMIIMVVNGEMFGCCCLFFLFLVIVLQNASVLQGRICSDNFTCCHTEIEVADQSLHLTQSQYTDTGPTSPSPDPGTPGAWQGSHWSANF